VLDDGARVRQEASNAVRRAAPDRRSCNASTLPARRRYPAARRGRLGAPRPGRLVRPALVASVMRFAVEAIAEQAGQGIDLMRPRPPISPATSAPPCSQIPASPATGGRCDAAGLKGGPGHARSAVGCQCRRSRRRDLGGRHVYELDALSRRFAGDSARPSSSWLTSDAKIISTGPVLTNGTAGSTSSSSRPIHPMSLRDAAPLAIPRGQCVKSLRSRSGDTLLSDVSEAGGPWRHRYGRDTADRLDRNASRAAATVLPCVATVIDGFMTQIGEIRVAAPSLSDLVESGAGLAGTRRAEPRRRRRCRRRLETQRVPSPAGARAGDRICGGCRPGARAARRADRHQSSTASHASSALSRRNRQECPPDARRPRRARRQENGRAAVDP